jgi:WD40 repeat protein
MVHLSLSHAFGVQEGIQGGALFVDETTVVYSVGRAIALVNTETRAMSFMSQGEKSDLNAMALSPSKKYLALCEGGDHAQVSIFHLSSQRKHRTLSCADQQFSGFVSAAFSPDSKLLAAIGAGGEYAVVLWLWEKGKMIAVQKMPLPLTRLTFSPAMATVSSDGGKGAAESWIGTSGPKFLKLWRNAEGQLKGSNLGLGKREPQNYTCVPLHT